MNTKEAYNSWAAQYDTNINKTRDLEAIALRKTLSETHFESCLEIGCGTGKNTAWLLEHTKQVTAVDFSEKMLAKAREKFTDNNVQFIQADITSPWTFSNQLYDLITFSLILEHIENLEPVFKEMEAALKPGGFVYIGELHPYKQYEGSKARFETETGLQVVNSFTHHISDFMLAAKKNKLSLVDINEFFDDKEDEIPRLLTLLLKK